MRKLGIIVCASAIFFSGFANAETTPSIVSRGYQLKAVEHGRTFCDKGVSQVCDTEVLYFQGDIQYRGQPARHELWRCERWNFNSVPKESCEKLG